MAEIKKIKDLPGNQSLGGIKVKTPDGKIGYWASQWQKGVFLSESQTGGGKMYPQFVGNLIEVLEWEITDEPVNLKETE